MTKYRIDIDLTPLHAVMERAAERAYTGVHLAVQQTAEEIREQWQGAVARMMPVRDAWTMQWRDAAVDSIEAKSTGPFSAVVSSDHQAVVELERGRPARDLKRMLQTSSRTKVSAAGKKYLTIPFRHGTPGHDALSPAMPADVHKLATKMGHSEITGRTSRLNAHGALVPQSEYRWDKKGDPFGRGRKKLLSIGALPSGLASKLQPSHKSDPYAGMRRFKTENGASQYLTFRVMHESSSGWIVPAKPGQHVAKAIAAAGGAVLTLRARELLARIGT